MAFRLSSWVENEGGNLEQDERYQRSKRLCTGLSDASEPWSTVQTQCSDSQILPEQSHDDSSRYDSNVFDVQGGSASTVDGVPWQHVGSTQNLTNPSSDLNPQPYNYEAGDEIRDYTPSAYQQDPFLQTRTDAISNACDPCNSASSVITSQPTPTLNTPDAGGRHGVSTVQQHGCQDTMSEGTSEATESVAIGHNDKSNELCLGMVRHIYLWHEVLRPRRGGQFLEPKLG